MPAQPCANTERRLLAPRLLFVPTMKPNKLQFKKETLRTLSSDELSAVAGGWLFVAISRPVAYLTGAPATTAITCGGGGGGTPPPATTAITCH